MHAAIHCEHFTERSAFASAGVSPVWSGRVPQPKGTSSTSPSPFSFLRTDHRILLLSNTQRQGSTTKGNNLTLAGSKTAMPLENWDTISCTTAYLRVPRC